MFTPHEIAITAQSPEVVSNQGNGVSVALNVIDDRNNVTVGRRGAGMQGAGITAADIIPALERELTEGLQAQGFTVVPAGEGADAELKARLRGFKFFIEAGFWAGAENANAVVRVQARRPGKEYERIYRHSEERSIQVIPEGAEIDRIMNETLANVLNQIMTDKLLMRFLTDARDDRASLSWRETKAALEGNPSSIWARLLRCFKCETGAWPSSVDALKRFTPGSAECRQAHEASSLSEIDWIKDARISVKERNSKTLFLISSPGVNFENITLNDTFITKSFDSSEFGCSYSN